MPNLVRIVNVDKNLKFKVRSKDIPQKKILEQSGVLSRANALAQEALFYMQNFIMAKAKNPTGNLIRNLTIDVSLKKNGFTFNIGNIDLLNKEAPYWYVLNYGHTIHGTTYGPKSPFNYIEATLAYIRNRQEKSVKKTKGFTTAGLVRDSE